MIKDTSTILYVSYQETLELLKPTNAIEIVEEVYRMHDKGTIIWSEPTSMFMKAKEFHNNWHVKGCILTEVPIAGVRTYSYFQDEARSTVGSLDSTRFVLLSDPETSVPLAIIDEHWNFAIRSTAAAVIACRWMARPDSKILGLVGVGTMGRTALMLLKDMYEFDEIRVTSRRPETRERFAREWSDNLGIPVVPKGTPEEVVRGSDIVVGGTTSTEVVSKGEWLKKGATFINLARKELDPADYGLMDKIVLDSYAHNAVYEDFQEMEVRGLISRERVYAEIADLVVGKKHGRESADERNLIRTVGLVSQDVAIANWVYERALERNMGTRLPAAHA